MSKFKKYSTIENHYYSKFIDGFVTRNPELLKLKYYIEEKIHGSNFQIYITKDEVKYGKRTSFIGEGEKFYNYKQAVEREEIQNFIASVQQYVKDNKHDDITIFGELYGSGVQSEVYYRDDQALMLFDIKVDGSYLSPQNVRQFIDDLGFDHNDYCVPLLKVADSLEEALEYDVIFDSVVSGKENNKAEGVVIKPSVPFVNNGGNRFIIKKKNPDFRENKAGKVKKAKSPIVYSDMQLAFAEYVNEARVAGIMSKYGEIENPKQIGDYIKYVFDDALEDFKKENEKYSEIEDDQVKPLSKISGKLIVPYIQKYL